MYLKEKKNIMILLITSFVGFFLDIYTKHLALTYLKPGERVHLIGNFLEFQLVFNKGIVFGINPSLYIKWLPANILYFAISIIAFFVLFFYLKSLKKENKFSFWGIALIIPGALGNFYDRLFNPERGVIDFIRMGISDTLYWPIYNFADIYLTIGIILLAVDIVFLNRDSK